MTEVMKDIVIKSVVRNTANYGGARISSKTFPVLNGRVRELLGKAVSRARENGRKTILPQDL